MTHSQAIPPKVDTLPALLAAAARSRDGITFVDARENDQTLPFLEIERRAEKVARGLIELGIRPGDRVAMVLPTSPGFLDAFFGTLLAGAVAVPLYPPLRLGRMDEYHARTARMLSLVDARLLIADARMKRLLGQAVERAKPALGCLDIEELRADSPLVERPWRRTEQPAVIQFSSGTTVDPKPVVLSHQAILSNLAAIESFFPEGELYRHAGVSWLPLYHDMGLIGCLLLSVYHPAKLALIPPELFLGRPSIWLRTISRQRATLSVAPNFALGLCTKRIRDEEMQGVDLSRWRTVMAGAEPISPQVLRNFAARFRPWGFDPQALTPVYGLSEATLAVTFSRPREGPATLKVDRKALAAEGEVREGTGELVSVGKPVPGVEVEIRGPDGRALPERRVGRIFVRSPGLMTEYFGNPTATAAALDAGWLDTGDLGFFAGGELCVCGRAKDVVILRGANHSPQEFEESLEGIEGLRPGCAVAIGLVLEGQEGEELALLAEVGEGVRPTEELQEKVRAAVLARTGIRPYSVRLLPPGTLPRTSSGKLRRIEAKRQLAAGEIAPPAKVTPLLMAGEMIKSAISFAKVKLGG